MTSRRLERFPAIRSSGKNIKVYALHGIPSSISSAKGGLAVLEVSDYQKGGIIAVDELAAFFATTNPIAKRTPLQFAYKQKIVDRTNAAKGYPYPDGADARAVQEEVGEALHPAGLVSRGVRWGWRRAAPTGVFHEGHSPE